MNHNDTMLAAELFWIKLKGGVAMLPPAVVLALSTIEVSDWVYRGFQLILLIISSSFGLLQIRKIRLELKDRLQQRNASTTPAKS